MKKNMKKSDLIIIFMLIIVFAGIIFMNTRLINRTMMTQVEQGGLDRLELLKYQYENVSADVEKLLNDVFAPIAKEAGVQLTAEDVKSFAENVSEDAPLSADDLADVNGGFLYGIFPLIGKVVQGITNVVNQMNKKSEPADVKKTKPAR